MAFDENPIRRPGLLRRAGRLFYRRVIPLLLLLAVGWSVYRVLDVFLQQTAAYNAVAGRETAYAQTATAAAPLLSTPQPGAVQPGLRLISGFSGPEQFATNTPRPDDSPPTATPEPIPPTPVPLPTLLRPPGPAEDRIDVTAIPTQVPLIQRDYNLLNIMLLGGDGEVTQDNFLRTDTMIIVSINLDTGTVNMLSLPRDLFVYIPSGLMGRLNVAYTIGEQIGWTDGGFGLLRQTIFYNFGINVHYYALVNFSGFQEIIDTLGGVDLAVSCTYQDYYPVDDFDPSRPIIENYYMRTLPVGYYRMNGFDALWYARTRNLTDDFDRGRRQQQILRAIWRSARDGGQLASLPALWGQIMEVVETDIPFDTILGLIPLGLNLQVGQIENYTMIRTYHTTPWQTPAGDSVQLPNYDVIASLLWNFYQPPTTSQLGSGGPSIAVYNGTPGENWDRVAAEQLAWDGLDAVALGSAPALDYSETVLIDRIGDDKDSLVSAIAASLNIRNSNIYVEPDPNRAYDYEVYIGSSYNSCRYSVLPADQ